MASSFCKDSPEPLCPVPLIAAALFDASAEPSVTRPSCGVGLAGTLRSGDTAEITGAC